MKEKLTLIIITTLHFFLVFIILKFLEMEKLVVQSFMTLALHQQLEQEVFYPSLREPRGLPRLQSLFSRWIARVSLEIASGCIYISGAVEYDDRPGPIREHLVTMVRTWQLALQRAAQQAVDEHHLAPDTDTQQLVFEMYGLVLALHHDARFIRSPGCVDRAHAGFARLIASTRVP